MQPEPLLFHWQLDRYGYIRATRDGISYLVGQTLGDLHWNAFRYSINEDNMFESNIQLGEPVEPSLDLVAVLRALEQWHDTAPPLCSPTGFEPTQFLEDTV
jgi:hypothetical protein